MASEVFSSTSNTLLVSLSKFVHFGHFYRKLTAETERIQWEKVALNPLVSSWNAHSNYFCIGKTRFTHAIAANKQASSHNFKIKNLNLLTINFLAIYLLNRGKSSYVNQSSMRVNNTFRKIIDCFWRKHCRDSPCQTNSVVLSKVYMRFFFLIRSPIDRCQIVTDICKNVPNFFWKPFQSPFSLRKWKSFGEASLFPLLQF